MLKKKCKLQLFYDYLMADPPTSPLTKDQHVDMTTAERLHFRRSSLLPRKQGLCPIEEIDTSILSDISSDHLDEEVDIRMIRPVKSKNRMRLSLAPLVQPSVAARHSQRSGAFTNNLTSVWNSTDESGRQNSQVGSKTIGPVFGGTIHPSEKPPLQQHQLASKIVIRLAWCVVCKSRLCFGRKALRCQSCQLLMHPECKEQCPLQCVSGAYSRVKEGILADFAPSKPPLVPPIVVQCVVQIEKRGLQDARLYRVPGAEPLVREWKYKLLAAQGALPPFDLVDDVHVICSILKDFLRNLKEPLVTFFLHSAFLKAAEILDESACHTELCRIVKKLPVTNRDTLAFLMLHLHRVMQSPDCQMDRHNLASIFGPLLVGHSTPRPSPLVIMEGRPHQCLVISHLLTLPLTFWKHFIEEEPENLVSSVHQPIVMNEQEASPVQLSPGNGCFQNKIHNCMDTTLPLLNVSHAKKTGSLFPPPK
ncbi:rac GTPase-activating protein 1-like isoform X2 [Erythrolamprus reginae]|uniref:rac GTPase-activating protein 1-like isoform X2 n=1 Tax=Erythrolamprus reginae TaxID=121349 RepID=UPI00396CE07F